MKWIGIRYFLEGYTNRKEYAYINRNRRLTNRRPWKIVAMSSWVKNTRKIRKILRGAVREGVAAIGAKPINYEEDFYVGPFDGR